MVPRCRSALLGILALACTGEPTTVHSVAPARVTVVLATPPPATVRRSLLGVLQPQHDVLMLARTSSTVSALHVQPGDVVSERQLLVELDARQAAAQLKTADGGLAEARAVLNDAQRTLSRVKRLGDALATAEIDRATTGVQRAEAAVTRAIGQRDLASTALSFHRLRAPFSGEIALVVPEVGELVGPGSPVVRVVDVTSLKLEIGVTLHEVQGMSDARVTVRSGSMSVAATVEHVARAADPRTLTFPVTLRVPSTDGMLAGSPVDVDLQLSAPPSDAAVPIVALRDASEVWTVVDGKVAVHNVDVIQEVGSIALILGIEPGAQVIVQRPELLRVGDPVQAIERAP